MGDVNMTTNSAIRGGGWRSAPPEVSCSVPRRGSQGGPRWRVGASTGAGRRRRRETLRRQGRRDHRCDVRHRPRDGRGLRPRGLEGAFCGRREGLGAEVEREIRATGAEVVNIRADVRREEYVGAFLDGAAKTFGGLDILVADAGITLEKPFADSSSAEWGDVVNTNLRGVFYAIRHAAPKLIARGGGEILVMSSSVVNLTAPGRAVYTATKGDWSVSSALSRSIVPIRVSV
jgi:NAD(P)-dependent dehydrogenase (short-subunit alcohol dehydrogenase family)